MDLGILALEVMGGVDTADGAGLAPHQQGFSGRQGTVAVNPLQQIPLGDTGDGDDHVVVLGHFLQRQYRLDRDAHLLATLQFLGAQATVLFGVV